VNRILMLLRNYSTSPCWQSECLIAKRKLLWQLICAWWGSHTDMFAVVFRVWPGVIMRRKVGLWAILILRGFLASSIFPPTLHKYECCTKLVRLYSFQRTGRPSTHLYTWVSSWSMTKRTTCDIYDNTLLCLQVKRKVTVLTTYLLSICLNIGQQADTVTREPVLTKLQHWMLYCGEESLTSVDEKCNKVTPIAFTV